MNDVLKPCPFCGLDANHGEVRYAKKKKPSCWFSDGTPVETACFVSCGVCGANYRNSIGGHQTPEEAAEKWNTRAENDPEIARLREALRPFGEQADYFSAEGNDYQRDYEDSHGLGSEDEEDVMNCLKVGDLRRAKAAIAGAQPRPTTANPRMAIVREFLCRQVLNDKNGLPEDEIYWLWAEGLLRSIDAGRVIEMSGITQ